MGLKLVKVRRKDVAGLRDSRKPTGAHQRHPGKSKGGDDQREGFEE